MIHLCTVCHNQTDSYLIFNYMGYVHGFSLCRDIICVHTFQSHLKPTVIAMGFDLWR